MTPFPTTPRRRFARAWRAALAATTLGAASLATPPAWGAWEPLLGELMVVGFNFCPQGWLPAQGQMLSINQNTALFSLLGTMYGGNGQTTFALPDLRGRVPVGAGQGPGLSSVQVGQQWGAESVTLLPTQLPPHIHPLMASAQPATHAAPGGRALAATQNAGGYGTQALDTALAAGSVGPNSGGSQPVSVRDPALGMLWCIATVGVYPSRP